MQDNHIQEEHISLAEAAQLSGTYSQKYLNLRARQGKLKAIKIGNYWVTTKEWLYEYIQNMDIHNGGNGNGHKHSFVSPEPPINLPVEELPTSQFSISRFAPYLTKALVAGMLGALLVSGVALGAPYLPPVVTAARNAIQEIVPTQFLQASVPTNIRENFSSLSRTFISWNNTVEHAIAKDINRIKYNISRITTYVTEVTTYVTDTFTFSSDQKDL
ncbi:MAG: hypothetical protein Q8P70_01430, partial [bacterium]|nr:hypothetical protein [bacterium]